MSDPRKLAQHYRNRANALRHEAAALTSDIERLEMLRTAEQIDAAADHLERLARARDAC